MTDKLDLASVLEYADYRFVLNNQKKILKEKALQHLRHSFNGGTFVIDGTLISLVSTLASQEVIYLLDTNNNPIEIKEPATFLNAIIEKYNTVMSNYHAEYKELTKNRTVKTLVQWVKVY